jgi:hypothetical protein
MPCKTRLVPMVCSAIALASLPRVCRAESATRIGPPVSLPRLKRGWLLETYGGKWLRPAFTTHQPSAIRATARVQSLWRDLIELHWANAEILAVEIEPWPPFPTASELLLSMPHTSRTRSQLDEIEARIFGTGVSVRRYGAGPVVFGVSAAPWGGMYGGIGLVVTGRFF